MEQILFWFFLGCAVVGGGIMVLQLGLALLGLSHAFGLPEDMPYDIPDDIPPDVPIPDAAPVDGGHAHVPDHGATELVGFLSFRAIVAAVAFLGIGGLASLAAHLSPFPTFIICSLSALFAMFVVYLLMTTIAKLRVDGTVRIEQAIGLPAIVYLTIPAGLGGKGKVHIRLPERFCEYQAQTTNPHPLATGAKVVVTGIAGPGLLEVQPIPEAAATESPAAESAAAADLLTN